MQTIEKLFDEWAALVIPPQAPAVQYTECRRAFYAGAFALLTAERKAAESDMDDEAGCDLLEGFWNECMAFYQDVKAGRK